MGGDIAQSAAADQYSDAATWLKEVSDVGLCPWAQVWVVPGNHDVDRSVLDTDPLRPYLHEVVRAAMASKDFVKVDKILHDWFLANAAADRLVDSLAAYNDFASQFGCATSAQSPSWTDPTLDIGGLQVQLTGLNSVLVSDTRDVKTKPSLAIGRRQCEFERSPGRVHIAFAHHPPEWLGDWEAIEPYLRSRAHVVLFGHEHRFSTEQCEEGGTVIIRAGAVGPEPGGDGPLVPSWNLITVTRADPYLEVTVQPRVWSSERTCFEAHPDGTTTTRVLIDLLSKDDILGRDATAMDGSIEEKAVTSATPLLPSAEEVSAGQELPAAEDRRTTREIAVKFLKLPRTRQRMIARELGIDADLDAVAGGRLGNEILERVRHSDLINDLMEKLGHA